MISEAVAEAVHRARKAQADVASWTQAQADEAVTAAGWHCYQEGTARRLARLSFEETGLGNVEDLFTLQRRRTLGILRDLHGVRTVGVVDEQPELGLVRIAKPLGVIAVASPTTAPAPGIICNALPMLKTRNAVVFSPHPRAQRAARATIEVLRAGLAEVGAPPDLVQCLPAAGREAGRELMAAADSVVAIGGAGTVRRAYHSGTPAIGAGVGNPTVIVDETADLADAVSKIHTGAGFNNGTSCSSESNVLVHASVAADFEAGLVRAGAHVCGEDETARLTALLWPDGATLNRMMIGRPVAEIARAAGIALDQPEKVSVLVVRCADPRRDDVVLREKISPLLTVAAYDDFDEAVRLVQAISDRCGRGHSCAVHTSSVPRVMRLAEAVASCRVVVNQSTMTNTGSFDSGVPFTTTLSSGSWGGSSVSGNVTWRHFLNHTTVSRPIPSRLPDEAVIFGGYWRHGREQEAVTAAEQRAM
ncbi:aldehyde dehydrogenase family protein [Streptomyces sp. NL15-2K]|uniref:aldehyde dehydrogenase family protein n=1 Tax=Streptomyces sp. NL15-2K TaxID=376149 RepID=UPI000F56E955|nr:MULTISPECIES: aldehyde dehydrogenase family protein [Actinomycetes]WKX14156.1 aldehyde dehydrogenase family protein [Kutzneria buriramensis]GCB44687.1 alcohol dehydrogenase [Streptomyces sp. NL15-2K]